MKQIDVSIPRGTFPAEVGDRVRVSLTDIEGLDMIEALVAAFTEGCGTSDQVTLRYDETLLPSTVEKLSRCNIYGFQEICDCCSARPCVEVFAPTEIVENVTRFMMILPGPFRLDQVKFYSPDPEIVLHGQRIVDELGNPVVDENSNNLTT